MPGLIAVSPFTKLPNARLEHLVGMETCILAKECPRKGRDQLLGRVTQDKMAGDEPRRGIDLVLTIEGIEQMGADFIDLQQEGHRVGRHRRQAATLAARSDNERDGGPLPRGADHVRLRWGHRHPNPPIRWRSA